MKRLHYFLLALLVISGIGAGLLLVPSRKEMAFLQLKGRELDEARRGYEALLAAGRLSLEVALPLAEVYLESGEVDEAADLMHRLVVAEPANMEARRAAARFYRFAGRRTDYRDNLAALAEQEPSAENLRELAELYGAPFAPDRLVPVLQKLTQRFPDDDRAFLRLAYVLASQGHRAEAADMLRPLFAANTTGIAPADLVLYFHLLCDAGQADEAAARATQWLSGRRDIETASYIASELHRLGKAAAALALLEGNADAAAQRPRLAGQIAQLRRAVGQDAQAFRDLDRLHRVGRLPAELLPTYLELLLDRDQPDQARELLATLDPAKLPDWLVARLALQAIERGRRSEAAALRKSIAEDYLRSHPLVAAELALGLGSAAEARNRLAPLRPQSLTPRETLQYASLLSRTGRQAEALRLLSATDVREQLNDAAMLDLARLFLKVGPAESGFALFGQLRRERPSDAAEAGYAILAAATGRVEAARSWLQQQQGRPESLPVLADFYFAAMNRRQFQLAEDAARRMVALRNGRAEQLWLAEALIGNGRYEQALALLRALPPQSAEEHAAYLRALTSGEAKGREVELGRYVAQRLAQPGVADREQRELVQAALDLKDYRTALPFLPSLARRHGDSWLHGLIAAAAATGETQALVEVLQADLVRADLTAQARELRVRALLEHGGPAAALPHLASLADGGGEWASAYEEALLRLGHTEELHQFWKQRVARTDLTPAEMRGLAHRMLDAGQKEASLAIFLKLAHHAPPGSPDVAQLLFLWGPRPPAEGLDWLEERARAAPQRERAAWLNHLINAGGARRAVALMNGTPR